MARTPTTKTAPAEMPEILPAIAARIEAAQDQALSVTEADEVFSAAADVGRAQALDFIATVATSALLNVFENIKKSKGWRYMRHPGVAMHRNFESLDEFCQIKLGKSYRRLQELSAARSVIGQEAFEQAERIGLRQVDYNAIKALPAPDQELVRRAVEESTSRDEVLDLLQELAARHGQEKQALTRRAEEAQADLAAQKELLDKKNARIDKLERDLSRIRHLPPDEALKKLQQEAAAITADAEGLILGGVRQGLLALSQEDGNQSVFMAGLLGQLQARLNALREEFNLPDVSNAADAELAAEMAEWDKE
ncbi:MAG: hypothetical protein Q4F13_06780 [Pseudomonadota bacterium]|nr:hypothetical protein [Pseudomonadota bacterium]